MQRPCWTIAFGIICVLVVPGAILTHLAVSELIPEISDLPGNLVKGFDEVFKFAYLLSDSEVVKAEAATALSTQCGPFNAASQCPNYSPQAAANLDQRSMQAAAAKLAINNAFGRSLGVVNGIANDKYFGTDDLKNTADELNKITGEMAKIKDSMKCYEAKPVFCGIFVSADGIVQGMAEVNKALDKFKTSEVVKQWDDNKSLLTFMHALPYFLVLSLIFFGVFWGLGGVCCCCRGGTKCGTLALIPSILLWLVSFVIYAIVMASGIAITVMADDIPVKGLKGEPSLKDAINHIQTNYPAFWEVVFAGMSTGLGKLLTASYFFVAVGLLQSLYTMFECCCCPYRKKAGEEDAAKPAEAIAEKPAEKTLFEDNKAEEKVDAEKKQEEVEQQV